MSSEEYFETYMASREQIEKNLRKMGIYDEDLLSDTMIDLHEWLQTNETEKNFVGLFTEFYHNRYKWQKKHDSPIVHLDNTQLAALHISDETDWQFREEIGQKADAILEYVDKTTFKGERKPELNRQVLHMWLDGMSYEQIGAKIGMDANSVLHVAQRMTKIIRKNVKNMPKQPNECHVGHPI